MVICVLEPTGTRQLIIVHTDLINKLAKLGKRLKLMAVISTFK